MIATIVRGLLKRKLWLYSKPLDFRKQLDGLVHIIAAEMNQPATDGAVYIFRNRTRDKVKLVFWERNGFFLGYKRLEKGRFDFPDDAQEAIRLNWEQLYMLLSGMPFLYMNGISTQTSVHFF